MVYKAQQEIIDKLLLLRGLKTKKQQEEFLVPDYEKLADPMKLPDMKAAVERIKLAHKKNEKICIYGDYDVDGLTATALLQDAFSSFSIDTEDYIPNRFNEGYGLSKSGIDKIAETGCKLIVTVDCGSKSVDEIKHAAKLGIDVIVTDHHSLGKTLPDCVAVINPKREDSKYPFKDFAGVGVAFNLVRALQTELTGLKAGQEKWLLDLVALGTTCDVVSMKGENRILTYWGLEVARKSRRAGFDALCEVSHTDKAKLKAEDFGFRFGPRLNASGRLKTAKLSLELLTTEDYQKALESAQLLDQMNSERRKIQDRILKEAEIQAEKSNESVLVLAKEDWLHGVVGIVASKLVERYKKPTFILEIVNDEAKGSARSFGDFNLAVAIENAQSMLLSGGGHALAAGVRLNKKDIPAFEKSINDYHRSLKLVGQEKYLDEQAEIMLDNLELVDLKLIEKLNELEPFGQNNQQPTFEAELEVIEHRYVGSDGSHLKLKLADTSGNVIDGIAFNGSSEYDPNKQKIKAVFTVEKNEFRDLISPQLVIRSITK